jgi:hydrogenase maturation protease
MGRTLVLGIGNTLLMDEGVGVHVVNYLQQRHAADDIDFVDGGTLSFTLAQAIEEADQLIVIDAAELRRAPGAIAVFQDDDMDRFLGSNKKRSVHEVSLLDLLAVSCLAEHLPARRALIGIQPGQVDWGDTPTEPVRAAIPTAAGVALDLIGAWSA